MSSKRISEETKKQIVALYLEGNSIYKISKDLGVGNKTVVRWVENYGFELRKTKYDTSSVREKKLDPKKVKKLYCEEDKNLTEIANFLKLIL
jgi:transposase